MLDVVTSRHAYFLARTATFRDVAVSMTSNIAERLRRLRTDSGLTQAEIAGRATRWGLSWKPSTVAALETEQRALTGPELLLLPAILGCPLVEIVAAEDDMIEIAPGLVLTGATVHQLVRSTQAWDTTAPFGPDVRPPGPSTARQALEAERQAARKLGVPVERVLDASMWLWGNSLTAQRDAETARDVEARGNAVDGRGLQALRGHVTRRLLAAIDAALQSGAVPLLAGVVRNADESIINNESKVTVAGEEIYPSLLANLLRRSGDAEQAVARQLGVSVSEVLVAAMALWGLRTLNEKREEELRPLPDDPEMSARKRQARQAEWMSTRAEEIRTELAARAAMEEASRALGWPAGYLAKLAMELWGRWLPEERDRILAEQDHPDSDPEVRRGEITHELLGRLADRLREGQEALPDEG
ncbi:helix-turn-helix transcriptional regulator [Frankia sp. R82]|uniref:helix-turn-helix transcriptional regulator n=1 Tax=Frankia sp. R82 TaxID=2950553 RepID=UPI002044A146|nr:helix-turn-helix transcriptional regulator [Frankia sp. R82]MCM3886114.1 helix-turn-helix domain-containing protein [Frankia sp. R82]